MSEPTLERSKKREGRDDDLPGDLPPLDGDGDDASRENDSDDRERLDDDAMPKDDDDPFDDETGEGDAAPELLGEDDERLSVLDAGEPADLDVGAADAIGNESDRLLDDTTAEHEDATGEHDDELGLFDAAGALALDGGEEGPSSEDESLGDGGLPSLPLAADDESTDDGALDDAASFFDGELEGGRPPAYAARKDPALRLWDRFGPPLSLPSTRALARAPGGVLAGGRELVHVGLEGGLSRMAARGLRGGDVTRVQLVGDRVFVTTEAGGVFVSRDGGAAFNALDAWREHVRPEEAAAGLDVVATEVDGLWGRTAQGTLLSSVDHGAHWQKADVGGFARALGADEQGRAVVLVRSLGTSEVLRRGRDGWTRAALPGELFAGGLTGRASVTARGPVVVVAVEGEGVFRSLDGATWSRLQGTANASAMAMLDDSGTVIVARSGEAHESQNALVRVGADGEPKVVGRWDDGAEALDGAEGAEGAGNEASVTALVVDEAHQVVWIAGAFGVIAFQPRLQSTG